MITDFSRAAIMWQTLQGSHGRWQIDATCTRLSSKTGQSQQPGQGERHFALAPMVMAGDVYGTGKLPLESAYSYRFAAGIRHHIIYRNAASSSGIEDSADLNSRHFQSLVLSLPQMAVAPFSLSGLTIGKVDASWPIYACITLQGIKKQAWRLEFPINHINCQASKGKSQYQVETGPVLIPLDCVQPPPGTITGWPPSIDFVPGYIFFNRPDSADLLLLDPPLSQKDKKSGMTRHFSQYWPLKNIQTELYHMI